MSHIGIYEFKDLHAEHSLPQRNVWVVSLIVKSNRDDQDHGTLGADRDSTAVQLKTQHSPCSKIDAIELARKASLKPYIRKVKNPST
jgi:hypothetical protein